MRNFVDHGLSLSCIVAIAAAMQGFSLATLTLLVTTLLIPCSVFLSRSYQSSRAISFQEIDVLVLLAGCWMIISALLSPVGQVSLYALFQQFVGVLAFFAARNMLVDEQSWRNFTVGVLVVALGLSIYAIVETQLSGYRIASATFVQRNSLASFVLLSVFIVVSEYSAARVTPYRKMIVLLLATVCLTTVFISTSRGVFVALVIAGTGYYLSLVGLQRRTIGNTFIAMVLLAFLGSELMIDRAFTRSAIALSAAQISALGSTAEVQDDVMLVNSDSDTRLSSLRQRSLIWQGAGALLPAVPWSGFGPGGFREVYPGYASRSDRSTHNYAHNDPLQVLIELGPPGLLLFVLLGIVILWRFGLRQTANEEPVVRVERCGLFWGVIAVGIHSLVSYNFYVPATLILCAVVIARLANTVPSLGSRSVPPLRAYFRPALFWPSFTFIGLAPVATLILAVLMSNAYRIGSEQLAEGDVASALKSFNHASSYSPNAFVEAARAQAYLLAYDAATDTGVGHQFLKLADETTDRAETMNPFAPESAHMRYLWALRVGDPASDSPGQYYDEALRRDPRYFPVRIDRARYLIEQGAKHAALAELEAGLKWPLVEGPRLVEYLDLLQQLRAVAHSDRAGD